MIELSQYDITLFKELNNAGYINYKVIEIDDKNYIKRDDIIGAIEDIYDSLLQTKEELNETKDKLEEVYREKQGCWYDSYVNVKMKCEELEENIETIKATLSKDDYFKLADKGVEL